MREVMCAVIADDGLPYSTDFDLKLDDKINDFPLICLVGVPLSGIFPQSSCVTLFGHLRMPLICISLSDTLGTSKVKWGGGERAPGPSAARTAGFRDFDGETRSLAGLFGDRTPTFATSHRP